MTDRVVGIVNPTAGRGRGIKAWDAVCRHLSGQGIRTDTYLTRAAGHATELARGLIGRGEETIAAVGGDGTVHEVVNGFLSGDTVTASCRLGVVPSGTGMDFARNMGMGRSAEEAAQRLMRNRPTCIDVGLSLHPVPRLFVNFAETGLGAEVVSREREMEGHLPGRLSFLLAALSAATVSGNIEGTIRIDGKDVYSGRLVSVVVANGRYLGGGMKIAPGASYNDGLFDVLVLGDFSRTELLTQIWKVYPGTHVGHRKVLWKRGRAVAVNIPAGSPLDLDGELVKAEEQEFVVLPAALHVLV